MFALLRSATGQATEEIAEREDSSHDAESTGMGAKPEGGRSEDKNKADEEREDGERERVNGMGRCTDPHTHQIKSPKIPSIHPPQVTPSTTLGEEVPISKIESSRHENKQEEYHNSHEKCTRFEQWRCTHMRG